MMRHVIVVEGERDRQAVSRAVHADCVITNGHALTPRRLAQLKLLQQRRGLVILTDPDYAGEMIRRRISREIPGVLHAYLPRFQALDNGDIGVENAAPEAIRAALDNLHREAELGDPVAAETIPWQLMLQLGLTGHPNSATRREALGNELGIGYGNARQFWRRLNSYRITAAELEDAWQQLHSVT